MLENYIKSKYFNGKSYRYRIVASKQIFTLLRIFIDIVRFSYCLLLTIFHSLLGVGITMI